MARASMSQRRVVKENMRRRKGTLAAQAGPWIPFHPAAFRWYCSCLFPFAPWLHLKRISMYATLCPICACCLRPILKQRPTGKSNVEMLLVLFIKHVAVLHLASFVWQLWNWWVNWRLLYPSKIDWIGLNGSMHNKYCLRLNNQVSQIQSIFERDGFMHGLDLNQARCGFRGSSFSGIPFDPNAVSTLIHSSSFLTLDMIRHIPSTYPMIQLILPIPTRPWSIFCYLGMIFLVSIEMLLWNPFDTCNKKMAGTW